MDQLPKTASPSGMTLQKDAVSDASKNFSKEKTAHNLRFEALACLSHMKKIFPAFRRQGSKLSRSRKKLATAVSYREGVYDRTGEPSVIFFEKEAGEWAPAWKGWTI